MAILTVSRTPLRASLFGGNTDLKQYYAQFGGQVLSFTIDKYIDIMVRSRSDEEFVVRGATGASTGALDDITDVIARECIRYVDARHGVEIYTSSDIDKGSGLGGSSSYAVGLLNALFALQGAFKSPDELAELACHVEIDIVGAPIGKQDQYAAAFGGANVFEFARSGKVHRRPLLLDDNTLRALSRHMIFISTGYARRANEILSDQNAALNDNLRFLHAIKNVVPIGESALGTGDFKELGRLLEWNWQNKRSLSKKIHSDEIDAIHERAVQAGAFGGKLLGAGGGGYFLFICPPERRNAVLAALREYVELDVALTTHGSRVICRCDN
jgi:D-glycero-alpha-D-manno-heptose-7-phosphate kinase